MLQVESSIINYYDLSISIEMNVKREKKLQPPSLSGVRTQESVTLVQSCHTFMEYITLKNSRD